MHIKYPLLWITDEGQYIIKFYHVHDIYFLIEELIRLQNSTSKTLE